MAAKSASGVPATRPDAPVAKRLWAWINRRLPVDEFIESQMTGYYAPKNFNIWYFFGSHRAGRAGAAAGHRHLPHHVL